MDVYGAEWLLLGVAGAALVLFMVWKKSSKYEQTKPAQEQDLTANAKTKHNSRHNAWKKGTIKLYKANEGYGFVTDGKQDYYFNLHAIKGLEMPQSGDKVYFILSKRIPPKGKNPQAAVVRVVKNKEAGSRHVNDERLTCPHCGRHVTPRLVTNYGRPAVSYCPYCGGIVKDFRIMPQQQTSNCFIATAVYGNRYADEVIALRRFRDEVLLPHAAGRLFVRLYYRFGPAVANKVKYHTRIQKLLRLPLGALARHFELTSRH